MTHFSQALAFLRAQLGLFLHGLELLLPPGHSSLCPTITTLIVMHLMDGVL